MRSSKERERSGTCKVHRACAFCELEGGQLLTAAPFVCPRSAVSTCLTLRGNSVVEEGGQFPERGGCGAHGTKGGDQGKEDMQCGM